MTLESSAVKYSQVSLKLVNAIKIKYKDDEDTRELELALLGRRIQDLDTGVSECASEDDKETAERLLIAEIDYQSEALVIVTKGFTKEQTEELDKISTENHKEIETRVKMLGMIRNKGKGDPLDFDNPDFETAATEFFTRLELPKTLEFHLKLQKINKEFQELEKNKQISEEEADNANMFISKFLKLIANVARDALKRDTMERIAVALLKVLDNETIETIKKRPKEEVYIIMG